MKKKVVLFVLLIAVVAVGAVFAQNIYEARSAGIRDGEIGISPSPWPIPSAYADNNGPLQKAYCDGYAEGQARKRTYDLYQKKYLIEPIYGSEDIRDPFTGQPIDNQSVGVKGSIPFPWQKK